MERISALASIAFFIGVLLACKGTESTTTTASSASAVVAPPKLTEITFVKAIPKPGTKIDATVKSAFKFTLAGKMYRNEEETVTTTEVQSSDAFRVTKAAIDVKTLVSTNQEGTDAEKRSVNPLAGSRYVVSRSDDGKLSALDASGSPVAAPLLAQIKDHFGDVVDKDKSRDFIPSRPVKLGEKLIPAGDVVLKILGSKDDGSTTIDGVEFILDNASTNDKATFNVSMTFTTKLPAQMRLRSKLDGTIDIHPKDTEITAVTLKGPLTILDSSGNEKGTGDMSFTGTQSSK